jgi:hypothetical protein
MRHLTQMIAAIAAIGLAALTAGSAAPASVAPPKRASAPELES